MKVSIGDQIGDLKVLSVYGINRRAGVFYSCSCRCGKTLVVKEFDLSKGAIKSCGCKLRRTKLNPLTGRHFNGRLVPRKTTKLAWHRRVFRFLAKVWRQIKQVVRS